MDVTLGFEDHERDLVAQMYWQAFGQKLGRVLGPDARGEAFVHALLDPSHAICVRSTDGTILGVVGFKTYESALVDGKWNDMVNHYGMFGAVWRAALLSMLGRDLENKRFLMDGIFVRDTARGQGTPLPTKHADAAIVKFASTLPTTIPARDLCMNDAVLSPFLRNGSVFSGFSLVFKARHP